MMGVAVGGLAVVEFLAFPDFVLQIVQVHQVAVELHAGTEHHPQDDDDAEGADKPFVAVPGKVVDALHQRKAVRALVVYLFRAQEMRQEDQGEESVADEGEGGEKAEIPEQVAFREKQAQEGADGGDAAQEYGRGFFPERLFRVSHIVIVDEDVQAVADGDAQHDGADTQGHQGHIALYPVHAGHGEDGAVEHRDHLLPHKGQPVETQQHDHEDQQEGQADGPDQVPLDGAGVGIAIVRVAVHQDADLGMLGFHFPFQLVHHLHQARAGAGIGGAEARGEEGQGDGFVRAEKVPAVDGDAAHAAGALTQDIVQQGPQVQRVHGNQLRSFAGFVFHDNVVVPGHLFLEGLRLQGMRDEGIPGGVDETGQMREAEVHGLQGGV